MEFFASIGLIVFMIWLCNKDKWKAHNRTCLPGYHTDWGKMNEDRLLNGMSQTDIYKKQCRGGYDVKDKKYETWDEWKAKRPWGNWN